jgi:hypothetical protein
VSSSFDYGDIDFTGRTDRSHLLNDPMTIEENFWTQLSQIQAESICWIPLDEDAYRHMGSEAPGV